MIRHDVPLPRLLRYNQQNSRWEIERTIHPSVVSLNLKIVPLSYSTMNLPMGETLPTRGYVQIFTALGFAGVFRVRSPQDAYGQNVTTAELEHAIVEVGDWVVTHSYNVMMRADQAMQTIFSNYRGTYWQLGSVSAMGTGQVALNSDHDRVLEAMLSLLDQVPDCMLSFDFSTTPWTVNVVKRGIGLAEGRLSRNVSSARIIYDDTELCTKGYYDVTTIAGSSSVTEESTATTTWYTIDADTQSKWGVIERQIPIPAGATLEEAQRVANAYMEKHKNPRFSISVSGEDLSAVTGEALDTFAIGKLFRLALPDYDIDPIEQVITELSWTDVLQKPEDIQVNLADEEDTAVTFIHDLDSSGGTVSGSGSGGRKKKQEQWKEYWTAIKKDDRAIELMAAHVDESDRILQAAGLYIDSDGVLIYSQDEEQNIGARIQVQADRIGMSVGSLHYDPQKHQNYSKRKDFPATGESGMTYYDLEKSEYYIWEWKDKKDHSKGGVYLKATMTETESGDKYLNSIKAGEIAIALNESGDSEATIHADHIYIGPESGIDADYKEKTLNHTLTAITTDFTTVNTLMAKKIEAKDINATTVTAALANASLVSVSTFTASNSIGCTGPISGSSISAGGNVLNLVDAFVSNDGKTLTITRATGGAINFNKGDTEAAYNQGWNDCIDAAVQVDRYTRSAGQYGGNRVHYIFNSDDEAVNVGTGWYTTTLDAHVYKLPRKK